MAKKTLKGGTNIAGAGSQDTSAALEQADQPGTQQAVTDVQESIEDAVDEAKPNYDEESWERAVEHAKETETQFEREVDSLAEFYQSDSDAGSLNTTSQSSSQPQSSGETVTARTATRTGQYQTVEVGVEPTQENLSGSRISEVNRDQQFDSVVDISQAVEEAAEAKKLGGGSWQEGFALALEEYNFDNPRAVLSGDEEITLPEDRVLDDAFTDLSKDDAPSIDETNLSPPSTAEHEDAPAEAGMSTTEFMQKSAAQAAEREVMAQEAVQDQSGEGTPSDPVDGTDSGYRDLWRNNPDAEPATGESKIYRFIPRGTSRGQDSNVSLSRSFTERLADKQPGGDTDAFWTGEVDKSESSGSGQNPVDHSVSPVSVARELDSDSHMYLGETAVENLKANGYRRVGDFAGATVDELQEIDGIGESKAELLIEHEGAEAQSFEETAQSLAEEIDSDEFGVEEYKRILEYGAENGVNPEETASILRDGSVRGEIPGASQPISSLSQYDNYREYEPNSVSVETPEGQKVYSPNHADHSPAADVKVEAVVADVFEPQDPANERQVVTIFDQWGNKTKLTVYKDSVHYPDSGDTTTGWWRDEDTDPSSGIDNDVILNSGDEIVLENPQVTGYSPEQYDGPALATTPGTSISVKSSSGSDGTPPVSLGPASQGAPFDSSTVPDYTEGRSRNLRRRERQYRTEHGSGSAGKTIDDQTDGQGRGIDDVDADI